MARSINLSADEKKLEEARKNLKEKKNQFANLIGNEILEYKNFKATSDFNKWFKELKQREAGFRE